MVLDKYQVFVKVAETRNLSKAAEELNYTHAAISYIIKNLEEEVGMKLLVRSKAGIHLTKEGAALLEEAQKIVKYENSFLQKASMLRGLEEGILDVGAFSSVSMKWMPHILREMKDKYPGVKVIQHHGNYKEIEHWVNEDVVLIPLVECGLGISVLPKLIMDFVHSNVVIKRFACPRYRTIGLAVKNPDESSGLTNLFISLIQDYIASIQNPDEDANASGFMIDCRNNI